MAITDFKISFEENRGIISLGEESLEFEVGDLSFLLISSPDYLITHLLQCFRNQRELIAETLQPEITNGNLAEELKIKTTKNSTICSFINYVTTEYNQINDSRIGNLFFLFPLAEILMGYRTHYGYKSISERYPSYMTDTTITHMERTKLFFIDGFYEAKDNPKETIKTILSQIKKPSITYNEKVYRATDYIMWVIFYGGFLSLEQGELNVFLDAVIGYCDSIINNLIKIKYIKPQLKTFIDRRNNKEFKIDNMPPWLLLELNQTRDPDIPLSLAAAIALEQEYLFNRRKYIRVCPICKRLFVAHRKTSKYCSEPNLEYNGRTCKEIGRNQGFKNTMKLYPNFNNNRKVYCNWIRNQHKIHPDIFKSENAPTIEKQLKLNYEEWAKRASNAVSNYEINKIQYEEAEALIELPDIEFRSLLLHIKSYK